MKITRIGVMLLGVFVTFGCGEDVTQEDVRPTLGVSSSPMRELLQAVRQAEQESGKKRLEPEQMKAVVVDAAKGAFFAHGLEIMRKDKTDFGNKFHRVEIHNGVFVVTSDNYWWRFTPVLENGQLKDLTVQLSPICMW